LGKGSDVLVAQIWLCEAEVVVTPLSTPPPEIQLVLDQYSLVFDPITKLPPHRVVDHKILLIPNAHPVNLRPYRYSYFQKLELEKIVDEMLNSSVIKPSSSPFASPVLLVKKKRWKLAFVH
jgi:hypothetical protein